MNITGMAKHLGTSKPTLYKRVKDAGLNLDELRDKDTGELTEKGYSAIAALFDDKTPVLTEAKRGHAEKNPVFTDEFAESQAEIAVLQREVELLREMLAAKDAELKRAEDTVAAWRQMAERAQEAQLLLTASADTKRRGLMEAIRGLFSRDKAEDQEKRP